MEQEINKRKFIENALNNLVAVELPQNEYSEQIIYFLFGNEEHIKEAILFLQDYKSIGFSLIILKQREDSAIIKLHDLESDDFYVSMKS
jgi:hypothetical protein